MAALDQLQELVDAPNETLGVEYKAWIDLTENPAAKADIARHLAALANNGGGYLVFGINDDMSPASENPYTRVTYDRDLFSSITKRYLEPPFQCDVHLVKSALGNTHPVVVVPPHGASPICAKANGPETNGKAVGIHQGAYYTRKPGPESERILTPIEWAPIIRRCAMHERAAIIGAIDAALRGAERQGGSKTEPLKIWHDAAAESYLRDIEIFEAPPDLAKHHFQLSYLVEHSEPEGLPPSRLLTELREINNEVRDLVRSGWSLFYIFSRPEIAPYVITDPLIENGETEFLECSLLRDTTRSDPSTGYDKWRVGLNGKATQLREFWEDDLERNKELGLTPHTNFSPNLMVQMLAELVRHSRAMAERFVSSTSVSFRCEWHGLAGRQLFERDTRWSPGQVSQSDHVIATGTWPIGALTSNLNDIVSALGGSVMRRFAPEFDLTPEWVAGQASRWLR